MCQGRENPIRRGSDSLKVTQHVGNTVGSQIEGFPFPILCRAWPGPPASVWNPEVSGLRRRLKIAHFNGLFFSFGMKYSFLSHCRQSFTYIPFLIAMAI